MPDLGPANSRNQVKGAAPASSAASTCPECGAPVSSSVEDYYCAELCGWSQSRENEPPSDPWIAAAETLDKDRGLA